MFPINHVPRTNPYNEITPSPNLNLDSKRKLQVLPVFKFLDRKDHRKRLTIPRILSRVSILPPPLSLSPTLSSIIISRGGNKTRAEKKRDEKRGKERKGKRGQRFITRGDRQCELEGANYPRFVLTIVNRTNGECYVTLGDR